MSRYHAEEWLKVAKGERKATWELWGRPIDTANCLTDVGRSTARWAVEKVSEFLGDEWLQKALSGGVVNSWMWAPWNDVPHTFRRIIELGARIATVESGQRWRDLKRLARQHADWEDVLLQLEVAALAVRDGWDTELEPLLPSGKKADLRLSRQSDTFLVESTLLGLSKRSQEVSCFSDEAMSALQTIAWRNGLGVTGELHSVMTGEQLRSWLASVTTTAERLRGTRLAAVVEVPGGGRIELSGSQSGEPTRQRGLSGPADMTNETPRLVRTLTRKARQGAANEPLWIRLDEGGAIWHLSLPSAWLNRRDMHEALAATILSVVDQFPHVAGVVMSESPMFGTGGQGREQWTLAGGRAVGLRQPLAFGFGREAVFVAGTHLMSATQLGRWVRWYQDEPSWLDWALARHDQAQPKDIFAVRETPVAPG